MLEATHATEARYVRALRGAMRSLADELFTAATAKTDAVLPSTFNLIAAQAIAALPGKVAPIFDRHARTLADANKKGLRVVGIKPGLDLGLAARVAMAREESIAYVVKAGREYAESVREVFSKPENFGLRVEDLKEQLRERGDVTEARAELIARDQTLKLNGAITEIRQKEAGVDSYVWSTSLDERVRPEHASLEGQTFAWSSPPSVGHPGEDFQCRCVAVPVIPELADL